MYFIPGDPLDVRVRLDELPRDRCARVRLRQPQLQRQRESVVVSVVHQLRGHRGALAVQDDGLERD